MRRTDSRRLTLGTTLAYHSYNQLELPDYPSKAILEKNLEVLFKWGNEGFGFM